MRMIALLIIVAAGISSIGCSIKDMKGVEAPEPVAEKEMTAEDTAFAAVKLIKEKDFSALKDLIHPTKGVRFTPYGYVDANRNLVFTASEIGDLKENQKVYLWGEYDGTGDPIQLSFHDYYKKFIYDADFLHAEEKSINKRLGQGNSIDNSKEVYPDATVVEFHFPGFEEKYEGMDWKSLRVVLEKLDNKWYVVGFIHDQWTI
ncbi:hypothetical protein LC085_05745 [Bacillus tianshenii]|uniref:hypothetical protein n=1 Tax=Sutcliffiella tianshenii TaxID=1463404 RepID=UPI001CD36C52|nr:hypothetical protein [Bacillus tianshenii]MCA1319410.1 hypothetical protein [Bacillus tianshenii]